ncbi:hypothetical protein B4U80_11084, partial [Leptotrombidium deliense]
ISDIHLSKYFDPKRKPDFFKFCTEVVDAIKPSVVLATGDLTDSRTKDPLGSTQYEEEWISYADVLKTSGVTNKTVWLDIRGNHDSFNIFSWDSSNNYYRKYSESGRRTHGHFMYQLKHDTETYSFIGVDACLEPSPKRPFNFLGLLNEPDINSLKNMSTNAERNSNFTFWFGHFPTSSISMPKYGLRQLIKGPYFCGHYHTLVGLINQMYANHVGGALELEVGDWKDSRTYRIASIDNGLFNFNDVTFNKWPVILITNPKASLYSMPRVEPLHRIKTSTHIRALVFSTHPITSVSFKIDDMPWKEMQKSSGELYVHEWNPNDYKTGLHWITVKAIDEDHNEQLMKQQFSIDGSKPEFTFGGRFALRLHIRSFFKTIYFSVIFINVMPLIVLRIFHYYGKGNMLRLRARTNFTNKLIFKLYLLSAMDKFFIPLIGIPLYATFGPWFIGEVIDNHWGICFLWGMIIEGHYLPVGFTYIFGALFIVVLCIPQTFIFACIVHARYQHISKGETKLGFRENFVHFRHCFFLALLFFHMLYAFAYRTAYGFKAFAFGILYTWTVVVYLILWYLTFKLTSEDFAMVISPSRRAHSSRSSRQRDEHSLRPLNERET